MEIKTVSLENFNKAVSQKRSKGSIQINNITVYGFFLNDFFFTTVANKYYRVTI